MAWDLKDQAWLTRIAAETAPPTDVAAVLSDELWGNAFSMWATDLGYAQGDYTAATLHRAWVDVAYAVDGPTIFARYVDPAGGSGLSWPDGLVERFARAGNGMDADYSGALDETRRMTVELLEPYVGRFAADVHELQSANVSEPSPVAARLVQPDMGAVDAINQQTLKDLPEFNSDAAGATVRFYATTDVVLIGDNHPASYYDYLTAVGYTVGTIMMMRRGSAFSAGRVEVGLLEVIRAGGQPYGDQVVPSQEDIRQAVTGAIGRVSKKEVRHNK